MKNDRAPRFGAVCCAFLLRVSFFDGGRVDGGCVWVVREVRGGGVFFFSFVECGLLEGGGALGRGREGERGGGWDT